MPRNSQTHTFDPLRHRGTRIECSLTTTASDEVLARMKRHVQLVIAPVLLAVLTPPLIHRFAEAGAMAELTKSYDASGQQVSLTVKVTAEQGFTVRELCDRLEEGLAGTLRLVDILTDINPCTMGLNGLFEAVDYGEVLRMFPAVPDKHDPSLQRSRPHILENSNLREEQYPYD